MAASEELIRAFREALEVYLTNMSGRGWAYGEPSSNLHSESMPISKVLMAVEASPDALVRMGNQDFRRVYAKVKNAADQRELKRNGSYACAAKLLRRWIADRNAVKY